MVIILSSIGQITGCAVAQALC